MHILVLLTLKYFAVLTLELLTSLNLARQIGWRRELREHFVAKARFFVLLDAHCAEVKSLQWREWVGKTLASFVEIRL